jgi:hypothetical protein
VIEAVNLERLGLYEGYQNPLSAEPSVWQLGCYPDCKNRLKDALSKKRTHSDLPFRSHSAIERID